MKFLNEIDIEDIGGICSVNGSTHVLRTCKIDSDKYYLKFSEESLFYDDVDPGLQILVEYLAYRLYGLYKGISIPEKIHIVYDKNKQKVGLATSVVKGKTGASLNKKILGQRLSAGVYVDIFLANWDVIGMGAGNIITGKDSAYRIDPGGSLTFRAQGEKKGSSFSKSAKKDIENMLNPNRTAGSVFAHSDLKKAAKVFKSVPWKIVFGTIKTIYKEISSELKNNNFKTLDKQWTNEVEEIVSKLKSRHEEITKNIDFMKNESKINNFTKLIKEEIQRLLKELSVDEPKGGPFGKVLFSPNRKDKVNKTEPNTDLENKFRIAYMRHQIIGDDYLLFKIFHKVLKVAKSGKYKNLIQPESNTYVYRLSSGLNLEQAAKHLGMTVKELQSYENHDDSAYYVSLNGKQYKSRAKIQSWTAYPSPKTFSSLGNTTSTNVWVLFEANTSNNDFLINPTLPSKVKGLKYQKEYETVAMNPVKLSGAAFYVGTRRQSPLNIINKLIEAANTKKYAKKPEI